LVFTKTIEEIIINYTNVEGQRVYPDNWVPMDFIEATQNLWSEQVCLHIFRAIISLKRFKIISRFDDLSTSRIVVEILLKLFNPGQNATVDEQLVEFRGRCPFRNICRLNFGYFAIAYLHMYGIFKCTQERKLLQHPKETKVYG